MQKEAIDETSGTGTLRVREVVRVNLGKQYVVLGRAEDVCRSASLVSHARESDAEHRLLTLFILALKKLLTRNLNRSSSVCMMINLKFVFGSMLPVWSSTSSICLLHEYLCELEFKPRADLLASASYLSTYPV